MDVTERLNQAIIAAKAGQKTEARRLLEAVLDADERNEQAWLWLGSVVESDEERTICLENVLTINPGNEIARKGLASLQAADSSSAPAGEISRPFASGSAPGADSLPDRPPIIDNRIFIVITIVLVLMLVCTITGIVIFVNFSPLG